MTEVESHNLLARVFIASPCSASWDAMNGTDRVRNCGDCSRQVFNLSDMSSSEAEEFLKANGTSQCLTFYRRKDGTIMTDDCPIGLRKVRTAARKMQQVAAMILGTLFSAVAAFAQSSEGANNTSDGSGTAIECTETTSVPKLPNRRNLSVWRKPPPHGGLQQIGSVDVTSYRPPQFDVPNFSELRSGSYALGKALVERNGRMFIVLDDARLPTKAKEERFEPVPTRLCFASDATAKILEAQGHISAAEAFHRIYLKTLETERADAVSYLQPVASDYRDFLLRQKRVGDARKVEQDFALDPEKDTENSEVSKPISKKIPLRVPGFR
jgi:hypothetical protein